MQDNLINQNAQPNTNVHSQPFAPQPNTQPVPQQNYTVPNAAQPGPQPYAEQIPQQYILNSFVKQRLCFPNAFSWIVFGVSLIYVFYYFKNNDEKYWPEIIFSIIHLITALLVTLSVVKVNAKIYKYTLKLYSIIFFIFAFLYIIIFIGAFENNYYEVIIPLGTKLILLIILKCYKNEFNTSDTVQMPANQEPIRQSEPLV